MESENNVLKTVTAVVFLELGQNFFTNFKDKDSCIKQSAIVTPSSMQ